MIYIASKSKHGIKWQKYLEKGYPINSTWIFESGPNESDRLDDLWLRCIKESSNCDVLVAYHEEGEIPKGSLVEIGSALASGKKVFLVGNWSDYSFHNHPLVSQYQTIEDALIQAKEII